MSNAANDAAKENPQIPAGALFELQCRVAKFNRRGAKRGFAPLSVEVVATHTRRVVVDEGGHHVPRTFLEIVISGEVPVLAGYTFLAGVQHTPAGNIVRLAPVAREGAFPQLKDYRETPPVCVHCNTTRARKDTFVLRTPTGGLVQIGRNCLASYLGTADPEQALRLWSLDAEIRELAEYAGGLGCGTFHHATADYLAYACKAIALEGFRPKTFDEPTASLVGFAMRNPPRAEEGAAKHAEWVALQPGEADTAQAAEVIAWIAAQDGASDFMHSLRVAAACPYVDRTGGLLCAGVNCYLKAIGEARLKASRPAVVSEHFGEVGKRAVYTFTVTRKSTYEGTFGGGVILGLQDEAGRVAVWFASGACDFEIGDRVTGKATVKAHGEYRGTKQTTLSRCAFTKIEAENG